MFLKMDAANSFFSTGHVVFCCLFVFLVLSACPMLLAHFLVCSLRVAPALSPTDPPPLQQTLTLFCLYFSSVKIELNFHFSS